MELTPREGGVLLTVRLVLPTRPQLFDPVWLETWTVTVPALSPGSGPEMLVAFVGKGTVRVVLLLDVARACAIKLLFRVKLTIGKPKPEFANPLPATVKLTGGDARSIGLGVMELTPREGGVLLTVRLVLPTRPQLFDPVWLKTWTVTVPALSPGSGPEMLVAFVGKGTVMLVLVPDVARAWAMKFPLLL
jgi:hypothetical protein